MLQVTRHRYQVTGNRYQVTGSRYAHSSCDETKEHLEYLFETKSLKDKQIFEDLMEKLDKLSKKINKFIQAVESQL